MKITTYTHCVAEIISILKKKYQNLGAVEAHAMATEIVNRIMEMIDKYDGD